MFYPERGEIYDRNGHLLAGNRTVYEVGVSLSEMESPESLANTLSTYLGLTYDEVHKKLTEFTEELGVCRDPGLCGRGNSGCTAETCPGDE